MKYSCLLAFFGLLIPIAKADEWDKRTVVKFNEPVEVPGVVLPPGTYVMKLADSPSDRNIVQFFNKNETQIYATTLAIPEYRNEPTDHTVINFEERRAGLPEAIKDWYYPGDLRGEEFLYPRLRTVANTEPVMQQTPGFKARPAPAPAPASATTQAAPAPRPAPTPRPAQIAQAKPVTPASNLTPVQSQPAKELPKTGSDLPLIGLAGMLAIGAGMVLRRRVA